MLLRSLSRDWIVCPGCGEKHGECADWVKSMPHREICSCGAEMLCWFETEVTYHAVIEGGPGRKKKEKKDRKGKAQNRKGKAEKKMRKRKKNR